MSFSFTVFHALHSSDKSLNRCGWSFCNRFVNESTIREKLGTKLRYTLQSFRNEWNSVRLFGFGAPRSPSLYNRIRRGVLLNHVAYIIKLVYENRALREFKENSASRSDVNTAQT